ncbi:MULTISPECIES: bifunctional phosphoribosylaminoimidazolecarboxamide formyltransferase/IMP cyclohydrolase [Microbacterium]|jgi:phosphoribosylaminoimidazolecarboxamide formyltransferase/IMP cyclohydrolase|uniref:bifunctional phosphoribosylaminoimidazolecarboxamide formyltransferase/IMP cyclohydrolase n=1 Tax=Microbacterium TaxID=33882 RepID=UPI000E7602CB|nr:MULTISPECIES: bifunctional phosphoribosylaminoimidazolecarboxamide formyltransferase/IMP cyclohydrolase [Microbacterium]MDF2578602.1 bifunctional phosphoribosylaminoimidazolecarboxamide formyltransferase/IMP cyclohydrolase [Microbacterium sp.]RKE59995.1 phosphoribosylaminoimidazolecarboxamide formyltransferase/IMP cyclohydrolase [Microbacterium sp. AG238]WJM15133.1 bifunctional phosphoribosylaminoimidazolecarboxamide formyltransferase/IMP cyclohydrolase [Microbacterium arborescens]
MAGPSHDPALYRARDLVAVRRALISVSDKTDLLPLAQALADAGVEIVSTGGSAALLRDAGLTVTDVAEVTGFPESLDGRVKTLHPSVHAGLLADLRLESHEAQLGELGISAFDLVVVNLYPFVETVASGAAPDDVVEQIDIGGPAMVRASAKNFANVAIVVSPSSYPAIIESVSAGGTSLAQRRDLAARAFAHTAEYDRAVATWFAESTLEGDELPQHLTIRAERLATLRYGENSHQRAAIYTRAGGHGIAQAEQLQGKEMSYNNYVDADAALRAAFDMVKPAVAIIKHANPCGIAVTAPQALDPIASAHLRAHECDPVSAFGGVIAANRTVTLKMAENLRDIFTEVIVAPDFEPEALEVFKLKKNLRVLRLPADWRQERMDVRLVSGGLLLQDADRFPDDIESVAKDWQLVSGERPDPSELEGMIFAWKACRAVKSNAIVLAQGSATVGIGMGQVNRVDSCRLAVERAGERAAGSVAASDAFFPFADGPQVLIDAGIKTIIQPGGSVRDQEVVDAAQAAGVTMFFTGERHFFH